MRTFFAAAEDPITKSPENRRAVRLVFAHLALTVVSLGIALALQGFGRDLTEEESAGLYGTVVAAFATTIVSALMLRRHHASRSLLPFQLATDVAIVTSLVYFSGGQESIFTFLYVIVTLYAAVLFGRRGAMISASASAAAYGAMLLATQLDGWRQGVEVEAGTIPWAATMAIWAVHVGALYLVGMLASFLSSELQRTGQALDQSADDLRRLRDLHKRTVESLMSGLLTLDAEGVVTWFNPEAERITGRSLESTVGRPIDAFIPGAQGLLNSACPVEGRAPVPRARLAYRREDGAELHLGVAVSILRGAEGEEAGHVVIFQDVTSVVAMERELRRSERLAAVGEMAAKIAHEIRNPLASISGSIQLLRGGGAELADPESSRLMDIVVRETDRLNGLITDFLLYSRPSPPEKKEVAARGILEE
ncbi:PAS domain S-box protein, partial [Myxococcota bacterium]|nr:PAS domain S-box protein [Myxococcota bacterium]